MFAITKYKLFLMAMLAVLMFAKARSISISQIGDVRIEVGDGKWLCDKLECPSRTHRCYVAKHKDPYDPTTVVRTNICYSRHNHVLSKSITTETIDANANIKMHLNSYRSGVISSINSYNSNSNADSNESVNFDANEFNHELNNDIQNMGGDLVREVFDMNMNLQNKMTDMTKNLFNIF